MAPNRTLLIRSSRMRLQVRSRAGAPKPSSPRFSSRRRAGQASGTRPDRASLLAYRLLDADEAAGANKGLIVQDRGDVGDGGRLVELALYGCQAHTQLASLAAGLLTARSAD